MAGEITILVGTMTGTAEMVANEVRDALEGAGYSAKIAMMGKLDAHAFDGGGAYLICTSTYGNGDVPDNAQAFFTALETEKPDLSTVIYGVIGLGDRTYNTTYCFGGKRFDKLLSDLGAKRVGEPLLHDASSGTLPEDIAVEWVVPWAESELSPLLQAA